MKRESARERERERERERVKGRLRSKPRVQQRPLPRLDATEGPETTVTREVTML